MIRLFLSQIIKTSDRVELAYLLLTGGLVLGGSVLLCLFFIYLKNRRIEYSNLFRFFLIFSIVFSGFFKVLGFDNYASPVIFISYIADTTILYFVFAYLGKLVLGGESSKIAKSDLVFMGAFFAIVLVSILNLFFPLLLSINLYSLLFLGCSLYAMNVIRNIKIKLSWAEFSLVILPYIVFFAPVSFYLALPFVSEADIHSVSDIVGLISQGKSIFSATSGIPDEVWSIRYPLGFPTLSFFISKILNILGTDAIRLLWYQVFALFLYANIRFARSFNLNLIIYLMFLFSFNLYYWDGFPGGQIQEMLAYTIGLIVLSSARSNGPHLFQPLMLMLQIVIHPVVALPFSVCMLAYFIFEYKGTYKNIISKNIIKICISSVLFFTYIAYLSTDTVNENYIASAISRCTWESFFMYIHSINISSFGYPYLIMLVMPVLIFMYHKRNWAIVFGVWLLLSLILDGVSGHNSGGRFHAIFNSISIFPVACALLFSFISKYLKHNYLNYGAWTFFFLIWSYFGTGKFFIVPINTFMTFDDRQLFRLLNQSESKDGKLVANIVLGGQKYYAWPMRGASGMDTVLARINVHQLKHPLNTEFREKFYDCLPGDEDSGDVLRGRIKKLSICLKSLGFTHIFISSYGDDELPHFIPLSPKYSIGGA